ncbi:hypothetical protein IT40_11820 [Paracoccus versutus]|nr:hypothetical protein IT40_11820 [Paracoccus versutus]
MARQGCDLGKLPLRGRHTVAGSTGEGQNVAQQFGSFCNPVPWHRARVNKHFKFLHFHKGRIGLEYQKILPRLLEQM